MVLRLYIQYLLLYMWYAISCNSLFLSPRNLCRPCISIHIDVPHAEQQLESQTACYNRLWSTATHTMHKTQQYISLERYSVWELIKAWHSIYIHIDTNDLFLITILKNSDYRKRNQVRKLYILYILNHAYTYHLPSWSNSI